MREPSVSAIIPAYNGENYLAEAIESILDQDYSNVEIWVIDNNSTDQTREIAQSFPQIHYHFLPISDTALARNKGVTLSSGDYIAFLDQDDTWTPTKLSKQVECLEIHPEYGAVIGLQRIYLEPGQRKPHWLKADFLDTLLPAYLPSALLVRRSIFSLFDLAFPLASDVAWFLKAKHEGIQIHLIEELFVHRRIHNENTSNRHLELHSEILRALRDSLQKRRSRVCQL